jgi:NAD+ synthase
MPRRFALGLAQLNARVGDLEANAAAILAARDAMPSADVMLTPELSLVGYPPEDLVLKPAFIDAAALWLDRLAAATAAGGPALLVGAPLRAGDQVHNAMALLAGGRVAGVAAKHDLPNYGPFDEKRTFAAAAPGEPLALGGVRLGVPICEDIWTPAVCRHLKSRGAELLLVPNGSPFEFGKDARRLALARARVAETGLPLAYVNRVGGQDELVFDGSSFVLAADGAMVQSLADWEAAHALAEFEHRAAGWTAVAGEIAPWTDDPADLYQAMQLGLADYVAKNGFPGVVLGLSGGIDSALTAAVAVDALGAARVWCVMLPSRFTSRDSLEDAADTARLLGCRLDTISIAPAMAAFDQMLAEAFAGRPRDLAEENIQSRARAVTLMGLSNKFGPMLLTTGNKSEMSVGYTTIYGDLAGGFSVLKDLYKTTVFKLARWRNAHVPRSGLGPAGRVIPERVIDKPPTAELRENQRDEDSLPPYAVLDAILIRLVEDEASAETIVAEGHDAATVARVERLLYGAEYKRRQAPPGVKVGHRSFGRDRRYPITNAFRTG